MNEIQKNLLKEVAELDALPVGAYNIRSDSKSIARNTTANIDIISKTDKSGIDIKFKKGTKKESVHIPVIIAESGLKECVYNDFFIEDDCDVTIIAVCGISNCGNGDSQHDGIHTFFVGKNCTVRYIEKHYGEGTGRGKRVMNPQTIVHLGENSYMELETAQIAGVDDTKRITTADLKEGASLVIHDKIMTTDDQYAYAEIMVDLDGDGSNCDIISRGVAKNQSRQEIQLGINGKAACKGHADGDSIIMDDAKILAIPQLNAENVEASLVHEAAIGKIAGEQLLKLMTLGLSEAEAEERIVQGFLK